MLQLCSWSAPRCMGMHMGSGGGRSATGVGASEASHVGGR